MSNRTYSVNLKDNHPDNVVTVDYNESYNEDKTEVIIDFEYKKVKSVLLKKLINDYEEQGLYKSFVVRNGEFVGYLGSSIEESYNTYVHIRFDNCNFKSIKIIGSMIYCYFCHCNFEEFVAKELDTCHFDKCTFINNSDARWSESIESTSKCKYSECKFENYVLRRKLEGDTFINCDISKTIFEFSELNGVDFCYCRMKSITFNHSIIERVNVYYDDPKSVTDVNYVSASSINKLYVNHYPCLVTNYIDKLFRNDMIILNLYDGTVQLGASITTDENSKRTNMSLHEFCEFVDNYKMPNSYKGVNLAEYTSHYNYHLLQNTAKLFKNMYEVHNHLMKTVKNIPKDNEPAGLINWDKLTSN